MRPFVAIALAAAVLAGCTAPAQPLEPDGARAVARSEAWDGWFHGSHYTGGAYDLGHLLAIVAPTSVNLTVILSTDVLSMPPATLHVSVVDPHGEGVVDEQGASPLQLIVPVEAGPHSVWVRWADDTLPGSNRYVAQASWLEPAP